MKSVNYSSCIVFIKNKKSRQIILVNEKKQFVNIAVYNHEQQRTYEDSTTATASFRTLSPNSRAYRSTSTCSSLKMARTVTTKQNTNQLLTKPRLTNITDQSCISTCCNLPFHRMRYSNAISKGSLACLDNFKFNFTLSI